MKRPLTLLAVLCTVIGLTTAPAVATERPATLRVANFNIHAAADSDNVFDLDRTAEAIAELDASVVALQEVDVHWDQRSQWRDLAAELGEKLDMHVYFGPIYSLDPPGPDQPRREYGNALLSRYPIKAAVNHEITRLSTQDPDPKPELMPGFPEIEIEVRGVDVHLYATHLDYREDPAVRTAQIADTLRILRHDRGEPRILLGDFNATPDAAELRPLWRELSDAWDACGTDPGHTYPAVNPDSRIDYVTVSRGVQVRSIAVGDTLASDHRPVVADLRLPRIG